MSGKLSRREFLRMSALAAASVAVTACAKTATEAPEVATPTPQPKAEPTATPVPAGPSASQAPMWQEKVEAGTLPHRRYDSYLRLREEHEQLEDDLF